MGCSNMKSDQSMPVITKKQTIHDRPSMNPHMEDHEAEELHPGRIEMKKETIGLEASTKLPMSDSKVSLTEPALPYTAVNLSNYQNLNESEKNLNYTLNLSNIKPIEKVSFPNHEHRFDFDFLEDDQDKKEEHNENQLVDDILDELNKA